MKKPFYFIITILTIAILIIYSLFEEGDIDSSVLSTTTWIGGIGIIVLCFIALLSLKKDANAKDTRLKTKKKR